MAVATLFSVSVVLVAPLMLLNVLPPSVLTCHCTVGVGVPLADAVNETLAPAVTVWLLGLPVMTGADELLEVWNWTAPMSMVPAEERGLPISSVVLAAVVPSTVAMSLRALVVPAPIETTPDNSG